MAPKKNRGNTASRSTTSGRGAHRPAVKKSRDIPLLPIAVGAILLVFAIGVIVYIVTNSKPAIPAPAAAGIPCDQLEHSKVHYHAAVQIIYQGAVHPIPSNIGIVTDSAGATTCFYWLHVHSPSSNVIHIEAPASQTFTLGEFFAVWTAWNKQTTPPGPDEPLDSTHVSTFTLAGDQKLVVYIDKQDGKGPQLFTGDPKTIVLANHEVITLEITPPEVTPPPSYTFPPNV
ncbi:MAG: hypothetical protein M3Q90_03565 [Candidatus Dormibacteraeota bacterium]|nr:hypothetical protein [Candidatus Dormibacteraeota bacterium]